jgi:hypothetical protein
MTQSGNQPQAADFGDIFPSVGFGAYGSRNRRQRGVGNITLWSTTKQRANHGRNIGRNVTASRSGSWNVKGTSANTILINEVNTAQGVLTAATTAYTNATAALTTATDDLYSDPVAKTTPKGNAVISALNTARSTLSSNLAGFANTIDSSTLTDDEKNAAETERVSIASITQTQIPAGTYDPTDSSATPNISDIKALVESLSTAVSRMETLVATYTALTSPIAQSVTTAITDGNAEITRVATYDAAVITEANTAAAKTAATTALVAAQAAVY